MQFLHTPDRESIGQEMEKKQKKKKKKKRKKYLYVEKTYNYRKSI